MIEILKLIYLMLPAYIANLIPDICKNFLREWNYPLDFNKKINDKPILGSHKTIKGLVLGIICAIIVAFVQLKLYPYMQSYSLINYQNWLVVGFLQGFGALFGDAIKSFFKRRLNISPGKTWIPFDQIDYSTGALIFLSAIYFPGWFNAIVIVIVSFFLHTTAKHLGYYLNINKSKW